MVKRLLELESADLFGKDAIVISLSGREEISRPFEFMLTISSANLDIKAENVIGKPLPITINREEGAPRYVHGYICSFWASDSVQKTSASIPVRQYQIRVVPWLWFLSRAARSFVYLPEKAEKSILEILQDLMGNRVSTFANIVASIDYSNAKILSSRMVEHCVQYRECDLNFLTRTLERYGVYYYFEHTKSGHKMILSDQLNYPDAPENAVRYPAGMGQEKDEYVIRSWEHSFNFVPGKWEHNDFDFTHPSTSLIVDAFKHGSIPLQNNAPYEIYDYPGDYVRKDDGLAQAAIRLEGEEANYDIVSGVSGCKTFSPGYCFKLTEHPTCESEKGKSYLLTTVAHSASQPGAYTSGGEESSYSNSFSCISRDRLFRPAQITHVPNLASVQTAMVVGPSGEEIHTDEFGRVKVRFHWDRKPLDGENHSCWIRVSQGHGGRGFGGMDIPRVGEEVIVSFIEGDLDRPIITGRVYNKESMPPFKLPDEKTRSGLKSKTYKGTGFNELSMDDQPNKQQLRIHAERDMDSTVKRNRKTNVNVNDTSIVGGNRTTTIQKNETLDVKEGNVATTVSKGNDTLKVTMGNITIEAPAGKYSVSAKDVEITGTVSVKLVCGASTIEMTPASITIKSPMVEVNGIATTTVKGTMVKINC
jgi:type VI secretion system secreted protein VgrG